MPYIIQERGCAERVIVSRCPRGRSPALTRGVARCFLTERAAQQYITDRMAHLLASGRHSSPGTYEIVKVEE